MQAAKTDPPFVPVRRGGWPTRRAPRWVVGVGAVLLAVAVAVGLSHRPTSGQRAADLRTFLHQLTADVESCSGGVRESLYVLREIDSGASRDVKTALNVANTAAANCSPANNELLVTAVTGLIDWAAPRATRVAADVAAVLANRGGPAEAADRAALQRALRELDAQRTVVYTALAPAIRSLSPASTPPRLYG